MSVTRAGVVAFAGTLFAACAAASRGPAEPEPASPVRAESWPEADGLFHRDPRWLGADAAVSVDLGGERVLWLFGDTFVAAGDAAPTRAAAKMVRNSVAVERGRDPSRAEIAFHWRTGDDGAPASFFPEEDGAWFWPGHGVRIGNALTICLQRIERAGRGSFGFRVTGWKAVRIDDPDADPSSWMPRALLVPDTRAYGVVGAAVVADGEYVYAFGVREPGDHAVWLVRWRLRDFAAADLSRPEYWGGARRGFGDHAPAVVFDDGATEFSVSRLPGNRGWVEVQSHVFGGGLLRPGEVALRFAPALTGPWSAPTAAYRPPETARSRVICYAGKAHPELRDAGLVATYACNDTDAASLLGDPSLYYPRFVRLTLR